MKNYKKILLAAAATLAFAFGADAQLVGGAGVEGEIGRAHV